MSKYIKLIAALVLITLAGTGCQAFSNGIAKKTSCCDKVMMKCIGSGRANDADETGGDGNISTGSSINMIHNLPFITIAQ